MLKNLHMARKAKQAHQNKTRHQTVHANKARRKVSQLPSINHNGGESGLQIINNRRLNNECNSLKRQIGKLKNVNQNLSDQLSLVDVSTNVSKSIDLLKNVVNTNENITNSMRYVTNKQYILSIIMQMQ